MADMSFAEKIRQRAYELWQLDGCLEDCADEYWGMERALVEGESSTAARLTPAGPDEGAPG